MSEVKTWRFEYLPGDKRDHDFEFAGTEQELRAHFLANHVCNLCREEMAGGMITMHQIDASGNESAIQEHQEPYTNPLSTPCAAEWDWELIA